MSEMREDVVFMTCTCYRCEKKIIVGEWVDIRVGKLTSSVFVCKDCAKLMKAVS